MHSSRMHTVLFSSRLLVGGGGCLEAGVCLGVSAQGGVCLGVSAWRDVCLGVSARGVVCPWGMSAQGSVCQLPPS